MPLLSGQLAQMRAKALADLTGLCEIHRYTETRDDMGESTQTWAPVASRVPCRLVYAASATARERERLGAIGQVTGWVLVVPHNQDLSSKDAVYVTRPLPLRRFDVSQVMGPQTDEVRRRALVEEVS